MQHAVYAVWMKLDSIFGEIGCATNPEATHQFLRRIGTKAAAGPEQALRAGADFCVLHQSVDQFLCDDVFWFRHAHPIFLVCLALNRIGMNTLSNMTAKTLFLAPRLLPDESDPESAFLKKLGNELFRSGLSEISDYPAGAGAFEAEQRFHHHAIAINPAILSGRLDHGVLA